MNGIWLRIPRGGSIGDEEIRDLFLNVLKGVFLSKEGPDNISTSAGRTDDYAGLPHRVGALLANNPELSLSVSMLNEKNRRVETTPQASFLKVKAGPSSSAATLNVLSASFNTNRRHKKFQLEDETGHMQITRNNNFSGGSMNWGVTALGHGGSFGFENQSSGPHITGANASNSGVSYSAQIEEKGIDTKLRYIRQDGETNAVNTRIDFENLHLGKHIELINADRAAWRLIFI